MKRSAWLLAFILLAARPASSAQPERTVDGARVTLKDVVPTAPEDLAGIDLGPAPPAGSSRLIARAELARAIRSAGAKPKEVKLPKVVRIVTASKRWGPADIESAASPLITARLSQGIVLKRLSVRRSVTTPKSAKLTVAKIPKLPKRVGTTTTTVTIAWRADGRIVARAPVAAVLDIDENGARSTIARGARVYLVIERGPARVAATAVALADVDLHEVGRFRVESTKKILRARVTSGSTAKVVGGGA